MRFQQRCKATLLKSHFGIGILLQICCIFSEHLFLRTPLDGCFCAYPANKEASSRRPQDMPWRLLQHIFSVIILRLPKTKNCYTEDVFKMPWTYVLKTSWRHILKTSGRHVLKMSWRHVLEMSWRHYGDKQKTYWGQLYLTNLNVYLTNLYFTNLYLTILRRIQMH